MWRPRAEFTVPFYAAEREAVTRRQLQEYRRLLYVGLSRAQDRLYICGWQTRIPPKETCWHALCRAGLAEIATPFAFDATALIGRDGWSGEGLRLAAHADRCAGARSLGGNGISRAIAAELGQGAAAGRARPAEAALSIAPERGRAGRLLAARSKRA